MPWIYSCLQDLTNDDKYVEPQKLYQKWTKEENSGWLYVQRLPKTGKADQLCTTVSKYRKLGTQIAPPIGESLTETHEMVMSLWVMVCQLMGVEESNELQADVTCWLVLIFLTKVHVHTESTMTKTDKNLLWLQHYNFICLVNLPDQIRELGPIRNRWEGGLCGEKCIQKVKLVVQSVKQKN